MGIADDIINGKYQSGTSAYKKKKKNESIADQIINGTYQDGLAAPTSIKTGFSDDIAPVKKQEKDESFWSNFLTDAKVIGSNLLDSANAGILQLGKTIGMRNDEFKNATNDSFNDLNRIMIENQAKKGATPEEIQRLEELYIRDNVDSKPFFQEKIDKINQRMAENTEKATNAVTKKGAELAQSIGNNLVGMGVTAISPATGLTYFIGSATGSYYDEGIQRGMSEDEAKMYGGIMGTLEGVTEKVLAGQNIKGAKAILEGQGLKNALKAFGIEIGENFVQEAVMPSLSELTAATTAGKEHLNYDFTTVEGWKDLGWDSLKDGFDGALSAILINGATKGVASATRVVNKINNGQEATQEEISTAVKDSQKAGVDVEGILQSELTRAAEKGIAQNQAQIEGLQQQIAEKQSQYDRSQDAREKQIIQETINGLNEELNELTNAQQITDEKELRKQNFTYEAKETDSDIRKAVYESASKVMNNTEKTHKFVDVVAKIAEERGTTYKFTNNEQLKELGYTKDNATVNGLVNENGEVLINIDSAKMINTVVGHETTHLLEGTKEYEALKQIAIDFAKSKGDYDARIEKLTKLYEGTNADIEAELTSDIVGEYLFTDENFVKELSIKQPTVFEKIRNFISDLVVKFKGTEQEKQLRQLQRTFEKAYKAQGTQTSTDTKYSFLGEEMLKENDDAMKLLREAKRMKDDGENAEYIRQSTGWFKATDGNWKAEIDDSTAKMKQKLKKNHTYKLGDILDHKTLYALNDNYKNIEVRTMDMKAKGGYSREIGGIALNNKILNNPEQVRSTLLHEMQHATQHAEGWRGGTSVKKAGSWEAYQNNYGEKEAREVQARKDMPYSKRTKIAPSTQSKVQYSLTESTTDNQGRTLTKEQQEYFKDSKVRDENGNLLTMYHGTPNGDFTVFKDGTYFSSRKEYADGYQNTWASAISTKQNANNPKTYEVYLNITNPFTLQNPKAKSIYLNEFIKGGNSLSYDPYTDWTNDINNLDEIDWTEAEDLREWLVENHPEYDGLILDEGGDGGYGEAEYRWRGKSFVPFNANQIKNVDNTNPTTNPDIRYSLSEDTQGRKLSEEQKEYFKNVIPELKDENGNLKVLYHGTPNEFTQFNYDFIGTNGTALGKGFYLTDDRTVAEGYGNVMEVYANITKPMLFEDRSMTKAEYKKFVEAVDKATEGQFLSDYGEVDYEGYRTVLNRALQDYEYGGDDIDLVHGVLNTAGLTWEQGFRILKDTIGYDGVVSKKGFLSKEGTVYIPTLPEQIKSINNTTPTDNPDINLSLSAQGEEIAPTGQWNVRGEDIKLQVEEAIAPLQEKIESLTEQLETVVNSNKQPTMAEEITNLMNIKETQSGSDYARAFFDLRDKYGQRKLYKALNEYYKTGTVTEPNEFDNLAPTSQDIVEKQGQENFEHLPDDLIPPEIDETEFAPDEDTYEDVSSPVQERDIQEVGNRKVKAYQYEHPEVRPYFQVEADNMLGELSRRIEGERYPITGEDGYTVEWTGISRSIPEDIAYLKDNYGYSYAEIEKGLKAIIEDNGAENNAVSKRLEILIDERLTNGYVDFLEGYPIPPNQEYKNLLIENDAADYYSNLAKTLDDADIAPEQATMNTEPKLKVSEQVIPQEVKMAQNGNLKDTSVETQKQERAAKIMAEAPTPKNRDQRLWAKAVMNFIDKGATFEKLSLKTNNRELMGKWDSMLTSAAKAQNTMLNGIRRIDALNNVEEQVSKSLDDIRTKVVNSGKVQEFYEYMYHALNTDRMSLESKAQANMAQIKETALKEYDDETIEKLSRRRVTDKTNEETAELIETAKEYIRLRDVKNKPVFGDSVTAEMSQKAVEEFEMANPEFTEWAKDVYQYNNALRDLMVENNIISQETADLFAEMYPHYVPIKRVDTTGNAINVPLDTNRTSINTPIKRAKGGNQDILPMFDTMAGRTLQTYKAIAKNNFGIELKNTLKSTIDNQQTSVDEILDNVDQQEGLLQEGKNGQAPTFTVFEKGNKVTYEITQDMYDALKPVSDSSILSTTFKPANFISNFHRGVLTEYNPVFMLTNAIKDSQDILMNSQHAAKTYLKLGESYAQILKKGMWYKEYMANGGEQNSYFDSQDNTYGKENIADKILPLKAISKLNNIIELSPRLAEYIASRESGRSIEVSMLDAARVTTNFKAGGDITKWANRNGATFLNASMQGIAQQVRNVREAHSKGLKGYANLATKFALAGVPAMILNGLLWEDDEEYEELSDYVKTNYWIVGKYGDGNFIRIPKGRMVTVIQESFNQMKHLITGDEQADLNSFLEVLGNNLAPNNPVSDNILSPIVQAVTNKTWYGGDLVPTRLQDVPAEEQYDESIDNLSVAIGQKTGISPYKINYVLDQYSGGVGDVFLPMMTPQAEGGNDDLASNLLAPLVNKFTVDSTMKNQSVSDLYDLSDKLTTKANSSKATDEDILKDKYLNAVKTEMNELYKEKREIQNSDLSDSEKYEQVRDIQEQINEMAKEATSNYEDISVNSSYSSVAGKEYYKNNDGEWTKVRDEEASELSELGMTESDKNTYFKTKNEISKIVGIVKDSKDSITIDDEDSEEYKEAVKYLNSEKKADIVNKITNSGLKDSEKAYLYKKFYNSDTIDTMVSTNISVDDYLVYTTKEFKADYNNKGNAISGSRKNKVIDYVNTLDMDIPQKAILIKSTNTFKFNDYNNAIVEYVGGLNIDYEDKVKILKDLDMTVDSEGNVYWE